MRLRFLIPGFVFTSYDLFNNSYCWDLADVAHVARNEGRTLRRQKECLLTFNRHSTVTVLDLKNLRTYSWSRWCRNHGGPLHLRENCFNMFQQPKGSMTCSFSHRAVRRKTQHTHTHTSSWFFRSQCRTHPWTSLCHDALSMACWSAPLNN